MIPTVGFDWTGANDVVESASLSKNHYFHKIYFAFQFLLLQWLPLLGGEAYVCTNAEDFITVYYNYLVQ